MEQSKEYVLDFQRIFFGNLPWLFAAIRMPGVRKHRAAQRGLPFDPCPRCDARTWTAAVNNFSEHLIQRAGTAVNN